MHELDEPAYEIVKLLAKYTRRGAENDICLYASNFTHSHELAPTWSFTYLIPILITSFVKCRNTGTHSNPFGWMSQSP